MENHRTDSIPNDSYPVKSDRLLEAIEGAFGSDIEYAMLVKGFGPATERHRRYSPAKCIGAVMHRVEGNSDPKYVNTSFAER
jgi:hypothetical protein